MDDLPPISTTHPPEMAASTSFIALESTVQIPVVLEVLLSVLAKCLRLARSTSGSRRPVVEITTGLIKVLATI